MYDKRAKAEQDFNNLRQTKSAIEYASRFRQLAFKVHQGPDALKRQFYDRLKNNVKDELIKIDYNARTLDIYINDAITIDNRQFKRRQKRQGKKGTLYNYGGIQAQPQANSKKKRYYYSIAYRTHASAIDVDVAQKGALACKDKTDITCYNCSKKKHFKREYCSPVKDQKP